VVLRRNIALAWGGSHRAHREKRKKQKEILNKLICGGLGLKRAPKKRKIRLREKERRFNKEKDSDSVERHELFPGAQKAGWNKNANPWKI